MSPRAGSQLKILVKIPQIENVRMSLIMRLMKPEDAGKSFLFLLFLENFKPWSLSVTDIVKLFKI